MNQITNSLEEQKKLVNDSAELLRDLMIGIENLGENMKNIQKELHQLLEEFSDLFPEQLPKGRPPKQEVEFEIKLE